MGVDASGCLGGYAQPANRTLFPLSNGLIVWEASHSEWTSTLYIHLVQSFYGGPDRYRSPVGVMLSTAASPQAFTDFHTASGGDQLVVDYFKGTGTSGCITVKPNGAGIPGIQNGTNVTLQMVFDGGDGRLYQVSRTNCFSVWVLWDGVC